MSNQKCSIFILENVLEEDELNSLYDEYGKDPCNLGDLIKKLNPIIHTHFKDIKQGDLVSFFEDRYRNNGVFIYNGKSLEDGCDNVLYYFYEDENKYKKENKENSKDKKRDNEINAIHYTDKSILVKGDTKPIKDQLKEIGGKWNSTLKGWIFSIKKENDIKKLGISITSKEKESETKCKKNEYKSTKDSSIKNKVKHWINNISEDEDKIEDEYKYIDKELYIKYPNLAKFVKHAIVPNELQYIDSVINIYVYRILEELKNEECSGLDVLIHNCSPYAGYIDSGSSTIMNFATTELTGSEVVKSLRKALKKDKIECEIEDGNGF